jgi:hypothetical protein
MALLMRRKARGKAISIGRLEMAEIPSLLVVAMMLR